MTPQAIAQRVSAAAANLAGPAPSAAAGARDPRARARAQAEEFEAVLLNTMFQSMYTGIGEEGPLGNATGVGVWRSFLTEEHAKAFAKAGGIGLADHVYRALLDQQEKRASTQGQGASRL